MKCQQNESSSVTGKVQNRPNEVNRLDFLEQKMELNLAYAKSILKMKKGKVINQETVDGFILSTLEYRDANGVLQIGKFREKAVKSK